MDDVIENLKANSRKGICTITSIKKECVGLVFLRLTFFTISFLTIFFVVCRLLVSTFPSCSLFASNLTGAVPRLRAKAAFIYISKLIDMAWAKKLVQATVKNAEQVDF